MGNTQCLIKLAGPIARAKLSLSQKIMAIQHLCQYLPQPLMLILLLLTPPLLLANSLAELPLGTNSPYALPGDISIDGLCDLGLVWSGFA